VWLTLPESTPASQELKASEMEETMKERFHGPDSKAPTDSNS
jgi:hypothetical protein